ncbi:MAG: hypothetical protein J6Y36_04935 [Treponema sp.]|nr:hypothetical protein [Treponema sp.]
MGLLSHISKSSSGKKSSKASKKSGTGLLARAQNSTLKTFASFEDWAKNYDFDHCGLFTLVHGMYVISHAFGIDSQTIAGSVSSKDFWDGTLKDDKDIFNYTKDDQDFYNFLQFFSFDIKNEITKISFIKTTYEGDNAILMVFSMHERKFNLTTGCLDTLRVKNIHNQKLFTKNDFNLGKNKEAAMFTLSISESVEESIKSVQVPEKNIYNSVLDCVYDELYSLISHAFQDPDVTIFCDPGIIKIVLINRPDLDEMLLQSHINLLLTDLLCKPSVFPVLSNSGTTKDIQELISFMN